MVCYFSNTKRCNYHTMSIYKLGSQSFQLVGNQNPLVLTVSVQEPLFVMFKLQGCAGCRALEPVFSQLANSDRRVSYGICDLTENKSVAQMSKSSTTFVRTVPAFIIYAGGRPKAWFKSSEKTLNDFINFISGVLPKLHQQLQPSSQPQMIDAPMQQQQFVNQSLNQNMYGGQPSNGPQHVPDMPNAPRGLNRMMNGSHPNAQSSGHPSMKQCDPDDAECLATPHDVIPHNTPWEDKFRQLDL